MSNWIDPDDAPIATKEMDEIAQINLGKTVIRPATGYLGAGGKVIRTAPYVILTHGHQPESVISTAVQPPPTGEGDHA